MRTVLVVVLLAVFALAVFGWSRPDRFHVERSATVNSGSEAIVPHIVDFHQFEQGLASLKGIAEGAALPRT